MDRLVTSAADVKCRAVVHEPGVATSGKSVTGALSTPFDRELDEIRSLLLGAATFEVARPTIQAAATVAMTRFSVLTGAAADRLRAGLFDALWGHDLNLGDQSTLGELRCPPSTPSNTMVERRSERLGFDYAHVTTMVEPDGTVPHGPDTRQQLADHGTGHRAVT